MRYEAYEALKNGWGEWIEPPPRLMCCDCGLVHDMQFRVKDSHVYFRARRNNRATAAGRRKK